VRRGGRAAVVVVLGASFGLFRWTFYARRPMGCRMTMTMRMYLGLIKIETIISETMSQLSHVFACIKACLWSTFLFFLSRRSYKLTKMEILLLHVWGRAASFHISKSFDDIRHVCTPRRLPKSQPAYHIGADEPYKITP
jgi:hypothetical protein